MSWLENVEKKLKEKGVKVKREEEREREEREERVRQLVTRRKILPPLPKKRLFEFGKKKKEEPKKPLGGGAPEYDLVEKSGKYTYAFNLEKKVMYVWGAGDAKGKWGCLAPLVANDKILEIHVRGSSVAVKHALGRFDVRFMDTVVDEPRIARLLSNLSAYSLANVDFQNPSGYGELDDFRIYFKLPITSGKPEMVAARIVEIPDVTDWLPNITASRLLTLCLLSHATVIFGPPGSGKTTFLNSLLDKVIELYPHVNMSVVETVPELQLPDAPNIHRTAVMFSEKADEKEGGLDISEAVSRAFRFERPDILVLGELRSDALRSWQEVARSGIPTMTTTHAPSLEGCVKSLESMLESAGVPLSLTEHFKVYVEVRRVESSQGERTLRYVDSIYYFYRPETVAVIYGDGAIGEEKFVELISGKKTLFGSALEVYKMFKAALGVLG